MSYIGKSPAVGNFVKLDAISTSSTNTYNLTVDSVAFVPESANHMLVSLNGVIQAPLSSFSVSGSTITFLPSSGTLSSSDSIDFIMVYGNVLDIGTPSDSTVTNAKTNFVSTSSSAGLQIKGDGTTDGYIQLNCSQNSHGVKLKSPAHSSAQSYTLTLPATAPATDKMIQTNSSGVLSFVDAPSGGMALISSGVISSSVSALSLDNIFSGTYRNYKILITELSTTNDSSNSQIYGRLLKYSDGSELSNSKYDWATQGMYFSNSAGANVSNGGGVNQNYFKMSDNNVDSDTAFATNFSIEIFNPFSTSSYCHMFLQAISHHQDVNEQYNRFSAITFKDNYDASNYARGLKIYPSGGSLDKGYYRVYGYKDS